jgi:hypothetical protein
LVAISVSWSLFWIFIGWEIIFSKSKDSFSKATEGLVGFVNFVSEFLSEFLFFTIKEDLAASVEDSLWCTLEDDLKVTICSAHISNESVILAVL